MVFFEVLGALTLGRQFSKSLRKAEVNTLCSRCTAKNNGKDVVRRHIKATDAEEFEYSWRDTIPAKTFGFIAQKSGLQEIVNHTDNHYLYKCTVCGKFKELKRSKCFT